MISAKKSLFKRILIIIITILVIFSLLSITATKIVYDSIFTRYDTTETNLPNELSNILNSRERKEYLSGENRLTGYLYKNESENKKEALVVIAPGFRASADDYLWQINSLLSYGWSVFAFDTTGSCESEGESSVGFAQELLDVKATLDFIEFNNRFGFSEIALLGHSRGGYAACCALSFEYDISAVVAVSGINSAMEGVIGSAVEYVGPLAYGNYGFLWLYQVMLFGSETVNMSADEAISESDVPVLIIHGKEDEKVPIDEFSIYSHKDEINSKKVEYIVCKEPQKNGHVNLLFDENGGANNELMQEINEFLVKSLG